MRSELEQYQNSIKEFNERTRLGFESFIQSNGSDRSKLQLRCTPYTDKKGGYGSFDLDFGLSVYQHQQSKVDDLQQENQRLANGNTSYYNQAIKQNDIIDELQKQKSLQELEINQIAQANQQWQLKCGELQKRVDAVKKLIQDYKDEEKELELKEWEQSTIYGRIAIELEQALKGGNHEAN